MAADNRKVNSSRPPCGPAACIEKRHPCAGCRPVDELASSAPDTPGGESGACRGAWRRDQSLDLSTSMLAAIQGIMARSLPPTCSICDSALMRRREVSVGAPAAFSRMNFLAYSPVWMATRASRMAWRVCSVTILGPVSYSPDSALFEMEACMVADRESVV